MAKRMLALACCMLLAQSAEARGTMEDARRTLGQWGVSYCISQYSEHDSAQGLGSVAQGGYFQLGFHHELKAYSLVQKYFYQAMLQIKRFKEQPPNHLIRCIDIYEDQQLPKLIRHLDTYTR